MSNHSQGSTTLLGIVAGSTVVVAQLATYAFTPALPQLVEAFKTSSGQVQLTISAYLIGYSLTPLFCGPISEIIGRRKVLLGALGLFVAGNLACAAAPGLELLLLCLFFTALGSGALPTLGQSVLHDVYGPQKISKVASYLVAAMSITPIFAPLVGGQVAQWLGWREIFLVVAALGTLMLAAVVFILPETHPPGGTDFSVKILLMDYFGLLRNRDFLGYTLLVGFSMSGFVLMFSSAPFFFHLNLKMRPDQYGFWFLISSLGYPAGSIWSHSLMDVMPLRRLGLLGVALLMTGSGAAMVLSHFTGPSLYVVVPSILVLTLGLGISVAVGRGGALASLRINVGYGSAMISSFMMFACSVVNAVGSRFHLVTHQRVSWGVFVCACLALLSILLPSKRPFEKQ